MVHNGQIPTTAFLALLLGAASSCGSAKTAMAPAADPGKTNAIALQQGQPTTQQAANQQAADVTSPVKILTAPTALALGACGAVTVGIGGFGGFPNPTDTTVPLTTTSSTGKFYTDSLCSKATTTVTVAAGASRSQVFYRDTAVGYAVISVLNPNAVGFLPAVIAIGSPHETLKLAITSVEAFAEANSCNAFDVSTVLPTLNQDSGSGLVALPMDQEVTFTTTSTTGAFYSDPACKNRVTTVDIKAGTTDVIYYYQDSAAGTPSLGVVDPASSAGSLQEPISN